MQNLSIQPTASRAVSFIAHYEATGIPVPAKRKDIVKQKGRWKAANANWTNSFVRIDRRNKRGRTTRIYAADLHKVKYPFIELRDEDWPLTKLCQKLDVAIGGQNYVWFGNTMFFATEEFKTIANLLR